MPTGRQRGEVPLCHPPDTRLCGSLRVSADFPRGARCGEENRHPYPHFPRLFPDIVAGARPGADKVMSCGLTLSACTLLCRSCHGIREGAAQGMTSGCASSLRAAHIWAAPLGAAHSGLPHFEMPQQPGNALHLCCHSSALVPCALRGSSAGSAHCFPMDPGVSYCARPFRRGALLWGSWGSSRAVSQI